MTDDNGALLGTIWFTNTFQYAVGLAVYNTVTEAKRALEARFLFVLEEKFAQQVAEVLSQ